MSRFTILKNLFTHPLLTRRPPIQKTPRLNIESAAQCLSSFHSTLLTRCTVMQIWIICFDEPFHTTKLATG